uniref:Uncharacterized protein n=1 Tax=Globisporangium ultimum (strain ATCC 200006 / CBS 805.95 / DAOM BR144) TaxID=431595 RepID=K3WW15_GLOUD
MLQWRLTQAVEQGGMNMVKGLLASGADANMTVGNEWMPLLIAIDRKHRKITQTLLAAGANANVVNNEGDTPLIVAVRNGEIEAPGIIDRRCGHGKSKQKQRNRDFGCRQPAILQ